MKAINLAPLPSLLLLTPTLAWVQPATAQFVPLEHQQTLKHKHQTRINALIFHPTDPNILISGGGKNDGYMMVWNLQSGKVRERDRAQGTGVQSMVLSSDGQWLVTTGIDRRVHFRTLPEGDLDHTIHSDFFNVLDVAVTTDDRILVSGGLDGIRLWDLQNQRSLYTLARFLPVTQVAIHPQGEYLASSTTQGTIQLWALQSGEREQVWQVQAAAGIRLLDFSPDGSVLLTVDQTETIQLWDARTGDLRRTLSNPRGRVGAIAFHPEQPLLLTSIQNQVYLWNWQTGAELGHQTLHNNWVSSLTFSPDGQTLGSGAYDGEIKLWQWQYGLETNTESPRF